MSNFVGASLRDIQTQITNAKGKARDALIAEAVPVLETRVKNAQERGQVGKAKRTQAFLAQIAEGNPDYRAAFAASRKPKASKRKAKVEVNAPSGYANMTTQELAGMVAMLTTELAKRQ